jgi:transcription-repair coupling factor (superfamily II helicase)
LGEKKVKSTPAAAASLSQQSQFSALSDLNPGDIIVHKELGVGRYLGLNRLQKDDSATDFLQIEYHGGDKLYLPVYRLDQIQRHGGAHQSIALDRLGTGLFQKTKNKVKEAIQKLAVDLVKLYAERSLHQGVRFSTRDETMLDFESRFAFDETPDQQTAIDSVLDDLSSGRIMDRVICGDVGFGKTEVAMRAAFRVASEGGQVAVLVPTTILAYQHERSFNERFRDLPFNIASLSRFKSSQEQRQTLEQLKVGSIDIIIGTHRLLSGDVEFKNLALLIVDEEHRFGVDHKEKIKALKTNTHVLTLTATPIPRTLHMSLSGIRDISLIRTAPVNRLPIKTFIAEKNRPLIEEAIEAELSRGGQVFYLHNQVQTIERVANEIRQFNPKARVAVGHGQMPEAQLEKVMNQFISREVDVFVCTTIIESGIDLPSANTMIVERADCFGLSQLYQIRGRVGRGQQRAYAYLLLPEGGATTSEALERLEALQKFAELGSGFAIASHDLEMRGGGNLLGAEQSGHIAAVGFELYLELLEEAVREIRQNQGAAASTEIKSKSTKEPEIRTPFSAYIPEDYVQDIHQRLSFYKKLSQIREPSKIDEILEELIDRFGKLPEAVSNLSWIIRIKILLLRFDISSWVVGTNKVSFLAGPGSPIELTRVLALIAARPKQIKLLPDSRIVFETPTENLRQIYFDFEKFLTNISIKNK